MGRVAPPDGPRRRDALALCVGPEGAYRWHRIDGRGGRDVARAAVSAGTGDGASELAAGEGASGVDGDPTLDGAFVAGRYGSSGRARIDAWLARLARWLLGRRDYETGDGRRDDTPIRPGDGSGSGDSDT
jgi:hypothetical protein